MYVPLPGLLGAGVAGCGFPYLACPNSPLQVTVGLVASAGLAVVGSPPTTGALVSLSAEVHVWHPLDEGELFSLPFTETVEAFYAQTEGNYTLDMDLDVVTTTSITFDLSQCLGACKYIAWSCRPAGSPTSAAGALLATDIAFTLNGDMFTGAAAAVHSDPTFYRLLVPWERLPRYDGTFYVLPFALEPGSSQPTGETRLDLGTSQLVITVDRSVGAVDVSLLVCCFAGVSFSGGTAKVAFT